MFELNGGPAFPTENARQVSHDGYISEGMSLRDYFAAKAMQGFCSADWSDMHHIADIAYRMADAMLKARGNQNE